MVTIIDYKLRNEQSEKPFYSLITQSSVEMVQSKETGQFYATARKASIPNSFTEEVCKSLIGTQLPETVVKVEYEA